MRKYVFLICFLIWTSVVYAQEAEPIVALESAPVNFHDKQSIQRGAKFFATNCMVCHTLIYLRYNKLAHDAGILYEKMPLNIKEWPNGVKPPDLSLEINRRGANWVYTYLHSFYVDPKRPTGFNNLVLPHSAMPDILAAYQGQQIRVPPPKNKRGFERVNQWYDLVELKTPGSMDSEQFDETVRDVVNFLTYASEPYQGEQEQLGWWVIGFLIILFIFIYWLKHEYWKDLKRLK